MRHKYMTFVMLICVSVCFLCFCDGYDSALFGVRKAFIWLGCVVGLRRFEALER